MVKREGKIIWILMASFIFFSPFLSFINGLGLAGNYSTNGSNIISVPVKANEMHVDTTLSMFNVTEIESLCLRMHNNTAFMGIQPFARLLLYSASECRRNCIDLYPKCVAVMFYYLHERDKDHICYLFSKNSIDQDVALVPEKPLKKLDMIRSLEIVADCHQFDPFPPLFTDFTASTDAVSKKKRDVGYDRPIEATGPWSAWSECSPRSSRQVRSQLCEYGRNIQRRRCSPSNTYHHTLGYGVKITSYAPSIDISISYPPYPYQHPDVTSDEYKRIMSAHSKQMAQSCCYWRDYFRQKSVNMTRDQKIQIRQQLGIGDECPTVCPTSVESKLQPLTYGQMQPQSVVYGQAPPQQPVYGQAPLQQPVYGQEPPQPSVYGQASLQPAVYGQIPPQQSVPGQEPLQPAVYGQAPLQPAAYGQIPPQPSVPSQIPPQLPPQPPLDGQLQTQVQINGQLPSQAPISVWSSWSEWSFCSATCGVGMVQRYRICNTEKCIGENVEWRTCHQIIPCIASWAEWTAWSTCTATCGTGEKARSRYCYLGVGYCTGPDYEITECQAVSCPGWSQWEPWSHCSVTCGTGTKRRTRICDDDKCIGDAYQETQCYHDECEEWSQWQEWSACSVSCGEGVIIRERVCMGRNCIGESIEQNICIEQACATWQEWGEWSACSANCNFGISTRRRLCHGIFCPGKRVEVMPCHAGRCEIWSTWEEWSKCSVTCGSGIQQRYRSCIGDDCPGSAEDVQYCETGLSCPQWTKWTAWSRCSQDCGIGERVRHRECSFEDGAADSCKGEKSESAVCLERLCCEWTSWSSWTPCSHRCGTGRSSRTKICLRLGYEQDDSSCTGHCYGDSREDKSCSEHAPCATVTYPSICILATRPYYTPGLSGAVVKPGSGGICPPGYVLSPSATGYIPAPTATGYVPTPTAAGYVPTPTVTGYVPAPTVTGYVPAPSVPTPAPPISALPSYVPPSVTPGYTSTIIPSGYVSVLGTPDFAVAPSATAGYVPPSSVPDYFPAPATSSGYGTMPGVPGYVFVPGTSDGVAPSAPSYIPPPSAPGYGPAPSVSGYLLTSSGQAISPGIFIEVRCHWAEWYQWSACERTCYHHVKRRSRNCLGEADCICSGDAHEEMSCLLPAECKN